MEKSRTEKQRTSFRKRLLLTPLAFGMLAMVLLGFSACTEKPSPQTLAEHAHDHEHNGHGIPHQDASSAHAKRSDALVEIRGYRFKLETSIAPANNASHEHNPAKTSRLHSHTSATTTSPHSAPAHPVHAIPVHSRRMARFTLWVYNPQNTPIQNAQALLMLSSPSGARQTVPLPVSFPKEQNRPGALPPTQLTKTRERIETKAHIPYQATTQLEESGRYAVTVQVAIDEEKYNPRFEFLCP